MSEQGKATETCPACGDGDVTFRDTTISFPYLDGANQVQIQACVPQGQCANCGFEFTDARAERIKHDAICRHFGLLTSSEIENRRRSWGMTRQRYAQLTKIGEASLSRWERGASIQSGALDQLMYLLGFADNTQRLLDREISQSSNPASDNLADLTSRFPNLKNLDVKRVEATHFRLRAGAR